MGIEQSLDTGVSGMITAQLDLDTISNNLANLSTNGYKDSEVSFETALTQTSFAGSAPASGIGGLNPQQLGLGTQTEAVTMDMSQGALQSTGNALDTAIQGSGFFEVAQSTGTNTPTDPLYTRNGDFALDASNNLVEQGSGLNVVGEATNAAGVAVGGPVTINTTNNQSIGAEGTQNVVFQGNLSSADDAYQGTTLTSALPLQAVSPSGTVTAATSTTPLSQLTEFNTSGGLNNFSPPAPPASPDRTIYVFGTQPDGTAYSGSMTINPWTNTVGDLMTGINNVLTQGNTQFGQVTLSNGVLTAAAVGTGQSFSMFLGEANPDPSTTAMPAATSPIAGLDGTTITATYPAAKYTVTAADSGALNPSFSVPATTVLTSPLTITAMVNGTAAGSVTIPAGTNSGANYQLPNAFNVTTGDTVQYQLSGIPPAAVTVTTPTSSLTNATGATYDGSGNVATIGSYTVQQGQAGLIEPTFTVPAGTYGGSGNDLTITVEVNGQNVGTITPNGTYASATQLSLSSFPHVNVGDVVSYQVSGNQPVTTPITWSTQDANDSSVNNLTADVNGDGIPDMFQAGSATDVNAWQLQNTTNATMNWYEMQFVPKAVTTSIQVIDPNGGTHTLNAVMFKTGTTPATVNGVTSQNNVWEMVLQMNPQDGTIKNNVITGIQFDSQGNFLGPANLGTTAHGTSVSNPNTYVGTPASNQITVNWANAGTSTIGLNLGSPESNNGLTGYGTADSAQAISQDGSESGTLQSLSVSGNGDIVGLYSNGKSIPIYQLELATFANPAGLSSVGSNLYQTSPNSGTPILRQPGTGNAGTVVGGSLEASNVDIATQFTEMITAQRAYQVNARVIQTEDGLLQELTTLNTPAQ
jgi:flagellar hook protein FlgE